MKILPKTLSLNTLPPARATTFAYIALALTMLLWASAFVGLRVVLKELDPLTLTSLRMVIACSAMAIIGALMRVKAPDRADWPALLLAGVSGFTLYHLALNFGLTSVTAGQASFIVATIPTWTALISSRYLGERLGLKGWLGILLGLLGVGVLSLGQGADLSIGVGAGLVLISALGSAVNITTQKRLLLRYDPLSLSIYTIMIGCLPFFLHLPLTTSALAGLSLKGWAITLWLGLGPIALGYFLSNVALSILPATRSAQLMLLVPPLVSLLAWLLINEQPGGALLLGGPLILLGVSLGRIKKPAHNTQAPTLPQPSLTQDVP